MNIEELYFWQDLTISQRRLVFRAGFWLLLAALAAAWFALWMMGQEYQVKAQRLSQRYVQVAPMVEQGVMLQSTKGALAGMAPLAAAQQVIRELGLEERLTSIRPTQLGGGGSGVQIVMESLNLPELIQLMQGFRQRGGLGVLTFNFSHRLDNPELADLQLVLGR